MNSQGEDGAPPLPITTPATKTVTTPTSPMSPSGEAAVKPELEARKARERKASESYSFFDYSMIPDKMGRRNSGEESKLKVTEKPN